MFSFFKRQKTDPVAKLKKVLGDYALPSFPGTIMETLRTIRNPEASANDVAKVLAVDPGLTVKVLRMANSPIFSPSKKVENLSQAVALIGLSQLESVVLSVAVKSSVPQAPAGGYDFSSFWHTAMVRGMVAQGLARLLCPTRVAEAFTAGFLQDMAVPFLYKQRTEEYAPILEAWSTSSEELTTLERAVFPWDHAEVATWICHQWDLPENIASAIGGHHGANPEIYDCPAPVSLVVSLRQNDDRGQGTQALIDAASEQHGIAGEQTEALLAASFEEADSLSRLMV